MEREKWKQTAGERQEGKVGRFHMLRMGSRSGTEKPSEGGRANKAEGQLTLKGNPPKVAVYLPSDCLHYNNVYLLSNINYKSVGCILVFLVRTDFCSSTIRHPVLNSISFRQPRVVV